MTTPFPAAWPPPGQQPYGYPPAPALVAGYPLASPWERLGARIIDGFVVGVLTVPVFAVLLGVPFAVLVAGSDPSTPPAGWMVALLVAGFCLGFVAQAVLLYAYEVTYQIRRGATLGKQVLRLRVLTSHGGVPDRAAYRRRFLVGNATQVAMAVPVLGWFVATVGGFFQWLDALWCLWDQPYRQCLHDKYAGTVVVKVPA